MPKPKDSPALYELIARDRVKGRPDLKPGRTAKAVAVSSAAPPPTPARAPAPAPAPKPAAKPPRPPKPARAPTLKLPSKLGRMLKDPTRITAVICAAALLSFGAFIVVKWRQGNLQAVATGPSAPDQAVDGHDGLTLFAPTSVPREHEPARSGETRHPRLPSRVTSGSAAIPAADPERPQAEAVKTTPKAREEGLNYVVVENFAPDRRKDAESAVLYLTSHGISCTIEKRLNGGWYVVTAEGYSGADDRLDKLVRRVRALGGEYFAQGGRYQFQCFAKLYKGNGW